MYSDAIASGNLNDISMTEMPQSFKKLQSFLLAPVHVSRADAFVTVQWMLGKVVCR